MKSLTKKKTKAWLISAWSILISTVLVLSGVGIYFKLNPKKKVSPLEVNPLDFSIDAWDGSTVNALDFNEGYAGRKGLTKTIDSAASFVHFVNEVNSGEDFSEYKIYLNTNIDLSGHTINSIGNKTNPFRGKFDGGYYTIYNATINGNGLFGATENAVVENIGLYNCTINSDGIAGGLIGTAINTDVNNTYVRLGEIKSDDTVGGLIGEYVSNDKTHTISNSFADIESASNNYAGFVHTLNTNKSEEYELTIDHCYMVGGGTMSVWNKVEPSYVDDSTFMVPTSKVDFYAWSYQKNYTENGAEWCDYDYKQGSNQLYFNYPIRKEFVKVFLTGSGYESVVVINGKAENETNLAKAFTKADQAISLTGKKETEINLLVDKIFMEARAEVEDTEIKVNATKDTTIVRTEDNEDSMFVSKLTGKIILGDTTNARSVDTPTITLDGNREHVEANELESGALVASNGKGVEIGSNVILKDNVNNNTGYGGAVSVFNPQDKVVFNGEIVNCSSENGGGIAVVGEKDIEINGNFKNCHAKNGGAVYIVEEFKQSSLVNKVTKLYGENLSVRPMSIVVTTEEYVCSGTYENNTATNGGAILCEAGTVVLNDSTFTNNSAVNGGAIYAFRVQGKATMTGNTATNAGGAIFGYYKDDTMFISLTGGTYTNNTARDGGAVYTTGHIELGNVVMTNNRATNMAGAIYTGSLTWLDMCEIRDNIAEVFGDNVCMTGTPSRTERMSTRVKIGTIGGGYETLD